MCDTLVALGNSTKDGCVLFGKNSDRPSNEVQLITYSPRTKYSMGEEVKCTYISIPQHSETAAVILSQPWWMWGAEMGANEYGVVIGNEAVYTYERLRSSGLLGMDLLRLGLERGKNAKQALDIITNLLEKYGQGGGCAYDDAGWMYHNSFLIADPEEAYVLETADEWWVAEKVKTVRSISNELTIRGKGDMRREGIIQYAIEKGYCKGDYDFDFAITFCGSPPSIVEYSRGGRSAHLLNNYKGEINSKVMMEFLRDHQAGICMHGGFESTGSQVSHLRKERKSIHWFTGTTLPCLSSYKPYTFPIGKKKTYKPGPYKQVNPDWVWCKYASSKIVYKKDELKNIENEILLKVNDLVAQEGQLSEEDFNDEIDIINQKAWESIFS
ncbi:MAG: peptidase C69 [Candidatus Hodarchaeota archaeon]